MRLLAFRKYHVIAVLISFIFISACSIFPKKPDETLYTTMNPKEETTARELARVHISQLNSQNKGLRTFKGVGTFKLWNNRGISIKERAAWVVSSPDMLRMAVLVSGRPIIKFSTDGAHFYFVDLNDPKKSIKKIRKKNPSLDRLISIHINTNDIIALLAGRIPITDHASSIVITEPSSQSHVLLLEDKHKRIVEKIIFDTDNKTVRKIEIYDKKQQMRYQTELNSSQNADIFRVPKHLVITNGTGSGFSIVISRYITDVNLPSSVFVLAPSHKP